VALILDTRLLRVRRFFVGEPEELMQLAEEVTRGAFYICWKDSDGELRIGGTGFLVACGSFPAELLSAYVVTAAHIINKIKKRKKRDVWLLMNSRDGGRLPIKIPIEKWFYHPTEPIDVVVAEWSSLDFDLREGADHAVLFSDMAVMPGDHAKHGIREGSDVFMTGVFTKHSGRNRVIPILRVGNIALMPNSEELIEEKKGDPIEGYLVECRSTSGMSGSPAFCAIDKIVPPIIPRTGSIPAEDYKAEIRALYAWIGLVHGHWDLEETDLALVGDSADKLNEPLNTGIAVVVPAWKVMEVINHPELKKMRQTRATDRRKKNAPREDSADAKVKRGNRDVAIPPISREKFFEGLTKTTKRLDS
jgi:hypothetical protein